MTQVIVQPAGNAGGREHYEDTVANPVALTRLVPHLDEATRQRVAARFGDKGADIDKQQPMPSRVIWSAGGPKELASMYGKVGGNF